MTVIQYLPDLEYDNIADLEPFKEVGCIVSDIDGTMTSSGNRLYSQIRKFINAKNTKDIYFTVATGRTYNGAFDLLRQLNLRTGTIIALYNGAIILRYGTNDVIKTSYLSEFLVKSLVQKIQEYNVNVFLYSFDTYQMDEEMYEQSKEVKPTEKVYGISGCSMPDFDINNQRIEWISYNDIFGKKIVSLLISINDIPDEKISDIENACKEFESITVTSSGNGFIEIAAFNSNKGNIIQYLKEELQSENSTIFLAAGDNDNDIELFKKADIGVAVSNASKELLKYSNYICMHQAEAGFIDLLRTVANAKKYIR